MPGQTTNNDDLDAKYLFAVDRLVAGDLNVKSNYVSNLSILDKLFNDYLGFALITLGAAIAIFTAQNQLIKSRTLFIGALLLLGIVITLCSYVRSRIYKSVSVYSQIILDEYNGRLGAIDTYRLSATDENKGRLNEVLKQQKFTPTQVWYENFGSSLLITIYIAAITLLTISLAFKISW